MDSTMDSRFWTKSEATNRLAVAAPPAKQSDLKFILGVECMVDKMVEQSVDNVIEENVFPSFRIFQKCLGDDNPIMMEDVRLT